jgi:hypothetical protein
MIENTSNYQIENDIYNSLILKSHDEDYIYITKMFVILQFILY